MNDLNSSTALERQVATTLCSFKDRLTRFYCIFTVLSLQRHTTVTLCYFKGMLTRCYCIVTVHQYFTIEINYFSHRITSHRHCSISLWLQPMSRMMIDIFKYRHQWCVLEIWAPNRPRLRARDLRNWDHHFWYPKIDKISPFRVRIYTARIS